MTRPRVVIVGMGDTGVLSAVALARHVEVVGVSVKPMFVSGQELGLRLAKPDVWSRDRRVDFGGFRGLDGVRVVHGKVVGVETASRTLRIEHPTGGTSALTYDVLVIATGVSNGFWRDDRLSNVSDVDAERAAAHGRIAAARSVAVIGGGPAAVGSAAQIAERWPTKAVHLYFPGERALPRHHPGVWRRVERRLLRLGVDVHPGHRAVLPDEVTALTTDPVRWSTGQTDASADVVLWAIGKVQPNTAWLPAELLDDDGFVRVDRDLRVRGANGVFAIGDVAATDPLRTSARNRGHKVLARNVRAYLRGRVLHDYRPHERRWGSVLGPMRDGMVIYAPTGHGFRFPSWTVDPLLRRVIVRRGIYGGMRTGRQRTRPLVEGAAMHDSPEEVPTSLRYTDGHYVPERMLWFGSTPTLRRRRAFSRSLYAIHRPWFAVWQPRNVARLTTTGRRSGLRRSTFVKAERRGDRMFVVSIPGEQALWLRNLRANPNAELLFGGTRLEGTARDLSDDRERAEAYAALCDAVAPFDYIENLLHRRGRPSRTKIVELHRAWFHGGTPIVFDVRPIRPPGQ